MKKSTTPKCESCNRPKRGRVGGGWWCQNVKCPSRKKKPASVGEKWVISQLSLKPNLHKFRTLDIYRMARAAAKSLDGILKRAASEAAWDGWDRGITYSGVGHNVAFESMKSKYGPRPGSKRCAPKT